MPARGLVGAAPAPAACALAAQRPGRAWRTRPSVAAVVLAAAATFGAAVPHAHAGPGGSSWASLTPAQQQALAPIRADWPTLDADRRGKWLDVAARYPSLSPAEQARLQQRMIEWARMAPSERANARLTYQQARQLSPLERQAFWEAYQSLPADYRKELAERSTVRLPRREGGEPTPAGSGGESGRVTAAADAAAATRPVPDAAARSSVPSPAALVSPALLQRGRGVSTVLITTPPAAAVGPVPKVAVDPQRVDPATLLPRQTVR